MTSVVFVALVMSWQPLGVSWLVGGETKLECESEERKMRKFVNSQKEKCVSVYVWQYDLMKTYIVHWTHDK